MGDQELTLLGFFDRLQKAFRDFVEAIQNVWERIKEVSEGIKYLEIPKPKWNVPLKMGCKSQVFNRKPLMAVARSHC